MLHRPRPRSGQESGTIPSHLDVDVRSWWALMGPRAVWWAQSQQEWTQALVDAKMIPNAFVFAVLGGWRWILAGSCSCCCCRHANRPHEMGVRGSSAIALGVSCILYSSPLFVIFVYFDLCFCFDSCASSAIFCSHQSFQLFSVPVRVRQLLIPACPPAFIRGFTCRLDSCWDGPREAAGRPQAGLWQGWHAEVLGSQTFISRKRFRWTDHRFVQVWLTGPR